MFSIIDHSSYVAFNFRNSSYTTIRSLYECYLSIYKNSSREDDVWMILQIRFLSDCFSFAIYPFLRIYMLQLAHIDPIEFIFRISNRIFYFVFHHLCEISKRLSGIVDLLYVQHYESRERDLFAYIHCTSPHTYLDSRCSKCSPQLPLFLVRKYLLIIDDVCSSHHIWVKNNGETTMTLVRILNW